MKSPVFYCQGRSMKNVLLISIILCFFTISCTSKKHLSSGKISSEVTRLNTAGLTTLFKGVLDHQFNFQTLSARGKGFLTINEKDQYDIQLQLRMEQGKSIWMSVTTFLGMEAVRVLITKDSVQVINRLESVYFQDSFDVIQELSGGQLDFEGLQQLLLGNVPRDLPSENITYAVRAAQFTILRVSSKVNEAEIRINPVFRVATYMIQDQFSDIALAENAVDSTIGQNRIEINHGYHADYSIPELPNRTSILLESSKTKLATTLDYSRVEIDGPVSVPFSIPKGYKQIH